MKMNLGWTSLSFSLSGKFHCCYWSSLTYYVKVHNLGYFFFYFLNLLKLLNFIFNNLILYFIFNNLILYLIIKFINNLLKLISFFSNRKFLLQSSSHTWFEILWHIDVASLWFCNWHCRIRNECLWYRAIKSYTVSLMYNNWGRICRPPSMLPGFRQVWWGQG